MAAKKSPEIPWDRVQLAPLILLKGPETFFADRAWHRIVDLGRETDPGCEITEIDAGSCEAGELLQATSASLFADHQLVFASNAAAMTDAFLADALAYAANPQQGAVLVIHHRGGNRGKKLLDALAKADARIVNCSPLTRDSDKAQFVVGEFRRSQRKIDPEAVRALVEGVGSDLAELASACSQLIADLAGDITKQNVDLYYGGRFEVTGFKVADAAAIGQVDEAVTLARQALASGVDPVPLVAALAMKLRNLAKVGGARSAGLDPMKDLKLAPWQVERARRELRNWDGPRLAQAIEAVAEADAEVKGQGRDPVFAVERAVMRVAGAARRN